MSAFAALLKTVSDSFLDLAADHQYVESVSQAVNLLNTAAGAGKTILTFGNGGSAADAQHIAGELVGRYLRERAPFQAIALGSNHAFLTAWANDAGYAEIYAREIEGLGAPGDVAWGISTSGNSPNVVNGLRRARELGLRTIAMTGAGGGAAAAFADVVLAVPRSETPRIQEVHLVTYHAICAAVEAHRLEPRRSLLEEG